MRIPYSLCVLAVTLCGCPGGNGAIGDPCSSNGACSGELQCLHSVCVPRCDRAPDCGDGYRCDDEGLCHEATGQPGDACTSEVDCEAGLACQISGTTTNADGLLAASCVRENAGRPAGEACVTDGDCRNGTCDLGHCIDLCSATIDCGGGTSCTTIPRVVSNNLAYRGCLQTHGALRWPIPVNGPGQLVSVPVPQSAAGLSVFFSVEDQNQKVGATSLATPDNVALIDAGNKSPDYYFTNMLVRHRPDYGHSVLAMPATPSAPLQAGVYRMFVQSQRKGLDANGLPTDVLGTAIPSVTAVIKLDDASAVLDLHFYFLDLSDHPCRAQFDGGVLDATSARTASSFQTTYVSALRTVFAKAGISLGTLTYDDLTNHPDLDGLDVSNVQSLLELGAYSTGINVFFVRSLSPVGLQAFGPSPGPAGLAHTRQSGVVIGLDTLCYRPWDQLARITVREAARYMGLYSNVEVDPFSAVQRLDPIPDSDMSSSNLMYYSESGGTDLSDGQRYVLTRSPALR